MLLDNFYTILSSESVTSDVLHADSPPVPCYFPVFDRHSGRTESPLAE